MRTIHGTEHLLLVFAQVIAVASGGCSAASSLVEASGGSDASARSDSGEDSGPSVGCGPCGCGGGGSWVVTLDAGLDAASEAGLDCPTLCERTPNGATTGFCRLADAASPATIVCSQDCTGRRPDGLRRSASSSRCATGAYFASMAQLEAASVPAFRRVACELSGFGAPKRLVRAAERAARQEISHARAARVLARQHGAIDAPFEASAHDARSLEAFATENAVEGCVRETYGALVASWQAREASDPRIRAHFARIARDETDHAALAFRIDAWTCARLDRDARSRVVAARDAARAGLRAAIARETPDASLATIAGLPRTSVALALASELEARLG